MARFLGPGFYYKTFMWPRRWWPLYEHVLRRFIAGGTTSPNSAHGYYDKRYAHPDVVIAGGGPAGMAAAEAAAQAGAQVMLVEEEHHQYYLSQEKTGNVYNLLKNGKEGN